MATMKTLNGYGFDSAKLGGKAPEYYTNPRNLLDNSDFRNPVNQRGNGDVNTQGDYPIDRWMFDENGSGCSAGYDANYKYLYIVNNATDGSWGSLYHNVPSEKLNAGTYTICFHEKLIGPINMLVIADDTVTVLENAIHEPDENGLIITQFTISSRPSNKLLIAMYATQGNTVAFDWAALYEGSYTAETLPPYVPKGYAAELAECRRYFRRYTAKDASLILSGLVTSGAKDISVHAPELTPMRTKNVSIAYSGSGIIIRGVSGYATECPNSNIYGNISVWSYQNDPSFCATIIIRKKDETAWGLTNNTPVIVQFAANSTLDYIADL